MASVTVPPLPERQAFSDVSRRSPIQQQPTDRLIDISPSHLQRAALSQRLGVGITSGQPPGNPAPPTPIVPQLLVSPSPSNSTSSIPRDIARFLSVSFRDPQSWWRRLVLESILQSPFLHADEFEPQDKGTVDPITMGFGRPGRSIYGIFVEEYTKGKWKCLFGSETVPCPKNAVFKRFERAVEHVRSHLNHRPYQCDGTCSSEGVPWYGP